LFEDLTAFAGIQISRLAAIDLFGKSYAGVTSGATVTTLRPHHENRLFTDAHIHAEEVATSQRRCTPAGIC
jgi:hypothetical protein